MANAIPLQFDIKSDVSNFQRSMQLVQDTAKQKAASFALEFSGASKIAEQRLAGFAKMGATSINDNLAAAAKSYEANFAKASANMAATMTKQATAGAKGIVSAVTPAALAASRELAKITLPVAGASAGAFAKELASTTSAKAVLAGIAGIAIGYATVSAAIDQANAQIERFIKLGANAERAGVGVEFFQRFSDAAKDAKVSVEEIETALKKAGAAVTPKFQQDDPVKKQLNDLFQSGFLGDYQSKGLDQYRAAGNNEDRIRAAVTAMQELTDLGERLAAIDLAEKVFGSDVAERIRSGRLQIEAIAASLDKPRTDLVSQQQVEQAQEFRDRLDAAYKTIDDFFRVSVALEGSGRAVLDTWLMIAEAIAKGTTNIGAMYTKLQEMQGPLGDYLAKVGFILTGTAKIFAEGLNDQATGSRTIYDKPIGPDLPAVKQNQILNPPTPPRRDISLFLDPPKTDRGGGGGGAKAAAPAKPAETLDQVQTAVNQIERQTAALKGEAEAIGKNNVERQISINMMRVEEVAKQAGITLTDAQTQRIREASKAMVDYREAIEDARERQEALRSIGGDVLKGIYSDARNGATAIDLLSNAVSRLADRMADNALNGLADALFGKSGGTGGSGILSTLISSVMGGGGGGASNFAGQAAGAIGPFPKMHTGGIVGDPRAAQIRVPLSTFTGAPRFHEGLTAKEFPAILEQGERVLTQAQDRRMQNTMAGLAQATSSRQPAAPTSNIIHGDTVTVQVAQTGASPEQIAAALKRNNEERDRSLLQRLNHSQARYG